MCGLDNIKGPIQTRPFCSLTYQLRTLHHGRISDIQNTTVISGIRYVSVVHMCALRGSGVVKQEGNRGMVIV